jgi:hypothetical protein
LISLKIHHKTIYRFNSQWPGVTSWIRYQSRDDEGTQSPTQTVDSGWDRVGISRYSLRTRRAASGSARVSSLVISTIPISKASD